MKTTRRTRQDIQYWQNGQKVGWLDVAKENTFFAHGFFAPCEDWLVKHIKENQIIDVVQILEEMIHDDHLSMDGVPFCVKCVREYAYLLKLTAYGCNINFPKNDPEKESLKGIL